MKHKQLNRMGHRCMSHLPKRANRETHKPGCEENRIRPFGMWTILSCRQSGASRLRKNYDLFLNYLKELR